MIHASTKDATSTPSVRKALDRILVEIESGLRHGNFDYRVTCEVMSNGRRRLTLRAGKSYQFLIPADECDQVILSD